MCVRLGGGVGEAMGLGSWRLRDAGGVIVWARH